MAGVGRVDELVKDYLLYRGLNNALKSLEIDLKNDRDKGFRVSWNCVLTLRNSVVI